jgi:hypothetical protein
MLPRFLALLRSTSLHNIDIAYKIFLGRKILVEKNVNWSLQRLDSIQSETQNAKTSSIYIR